MQWKRPLVRLEKKQLSFSAHLPIIIFHRLWHYRSWWKDYTDCSGSKSGDRFSCLVISPCDCVQYQVFASECLLLCSLDDITSVCYLPLYLSKFEYEVGHFYARIMLILLCYRIVSFFPCCPQMARLGMSPCAKNIGGISSKLVIIVTIFHLSFAFVILAIKFENTGKGNDEFIVIYLSLFFSFKQFEQFQFKCPFFFLRKLILIIDCQDLVMMVR